MTLRHRKPTYFRFNGFEQLESKFMLSCSPLAGNSSDCARAMQSPRPLSARPRPAAIRVLRQHRVPVPRLRRERR